MKLSQSGPVFAATFLLLAGCGDDPTPAAADAGIVDADTPPADADPNKLSSQGLYSDIASHTISENAVEYVPVYELWADGAAKRRWIILPKDTKIDTSDMDHWEFPVGTKLFKEFATPDGKLLETRLVEKRADGTFFMGAFIWSEDATDATLNLNGAQNVLGTQHDVPNKNRCLLCHKGEAGKILGFSALQLSKDGPAPTLKSLAEDGLLTDPPAAGTDFRVPGAGTPAQAALGYLHANCGHCHTDIGTAFKDTCLIDPDTQEQTECMLLRLSVSEANDADPNQTALVKSLIGFVTHSNSYEGTPRLTPGNRDMSAIYLRPVERGGMIQMPPAFSTEVVDDDGIAAIVAWIDSLN